MELKTLSSLGRKLMDRRAFFRDAGLGSIALVSLLQQEGQLAATAKPIRPLIRSEAPQAARLPHASPKARRVLMFFCSGAVSHVDTFDYKPDLIKWHGKPMPGSEKEVAFQGKHGNLTKPLWPFKPRGQSGKMISDLFPEIGNLADDICFIHSMTAKSNTHGQGENQMSTGFTLDGFPSVGSWVSYALGSSCDDLPAFIAIPDPRGVPQVGPANWNNGFLPAAFQGTPFSADKPIPHLARPAHLSKDTDQATREFTHSLNQRHFYNHPGDEDLLARIASLELVARMQLRASEVANLASENQQTQVRYAMHDKNPLKAAFGRNCLLARRLLERDVRFVQVFNGAYAMGEGVGNWDGHTNLLKFYNVHAPILDQPCAALIQDLKQTGLLDDTLVVWVTEFGRMPTFQQSGSGRDHNPKGFTVWLAGAGVKKAYSHGATDEFGYAAQDQVTTIYDLHATILHLLGLNHESLTYYNNGIERRLTDVHGKVIQDILT